MTEWITVHPWLTFILAVLLLRVLASPRVVVTGDGAKTEKP